MKHYLLVISATVALLLGYTSNIFSQSKHTDLQDIDFFNLLVSTPNSVILDVQTAKEFKKCHIANAISAPEKKILLKICDTLSIESDIFIYCFYGERSLFCQTILDSLGFINVHNLKNGLDPAIKNPIISQYKSLICFK
ncbi:MAG TPA: rhodanese-like domain-containing protein [Salinivirgaceae bacterium]|nr:rhodanese-like domain-containing protein [Salinivirgaceae bacterium]HQA76543.1 rhodanese-like domain-containing protein [Salinivirgaceae bacterium]